MMRPIWAHGSKWWAVKLLWRRTRSWWRETAARCVGCGRDWIDGEDLIALRRARVALVEKIIEHEKFADELIARTSELEMQLAAERGLAEARSEFPGLSPAEIERLVILAQQCGEVVQACATIMRHGYESCSPLDERCKPNRIMLERKVGGLRGVVDLMTQRGDMKPQELAAWRARKRSVLAKGTHHQGFESFGERRKRGTEGNEQQDAVAGELERSGR